MRVYIVVEGSSEEAFVKRVMTPALEEHQVYVTPMQVRRAGGARGGGRSWQPYARQLSLLLRQQQGADVRVSTMIDLYAIPRDIPGYTEPGTLPGSERADKIEAAIPQSKLLRDRRVIPYVQVHEFEAFVFVNLQVLEQFAGDLVPDRKCLDSLCESTAEVPPEAINDSPETAPSKRILRCVPGYRKTLHGSLTVEAIGLQAIREACPRFNGWFERLAALGSAPGE